MKYIGVFGSIQGLNLLMGIIRNKFTSIFLGGAGLGSLVIYNSVGDFVSTSTNLGLPVASVRSLSEIFENGTKEDINYAIRVVRTWSLWSAILAVLVCISCAPLLNSLFDSGNKIDDNWSIALLAPMVFCLALNGCEMAILKGLRRLKRVAIISACVAASLLFTTLPFYSLMNTRGILIALNVSVIVALIIHLCFTLPLYPWRVSPFSIRILRDGWPLIRVGIPFAIAAMATSGSTMALLALILHLGSQADVGYYKMGYTIMVSYAGIVFTSLQADYFPRLSAVNNDIVRRNSAINIQIRSCLIFVAPMLVAMMVFMPWIIRILLKEEFLVINDMAICAAGFIFCKAITTPVAYMALARGNSVLFLVMELIVNFSSVLIIAGGYYLWGITGAGIGLSVSSLFEMLLICVCYHIHYKVHLERPTLSITAEQVIVVGIALTVCLTLPQIWKYVIGVLLISFTLWRSWRVINKETDIIQRMRKKFKNQ
ncbi:MAG: oligosaccharide flippase family protein [Bacteroidaceae bacterium]|nr:oligosaccharide flippase family protein [Bacteroidaceae bacterium]